MTATPGRVAYEAWQKLRTGIPVSEWGWYALDDATREMWEAIAKAAIDENDSTALAQLAMAQEAISDLAAERDRYRKALEAIAECRAGMPYPDAARKALEDPS
jgi:hypothetical protein